MRSNRAFCQLAGQYAVDMFIASSTLQVDGLANSSTVTRGRLSGFGSAPNMGLTRTVAATPPGMAQYDHQSRTRCSAGKSWWCRWSKPSRPA